MSTSVKALLSLEAQEKKPWRYGLFVRCGNGFGILTAEIALPYGESLSQGLVESWAQEHVPQFLSKFGQVLRYRILVSRNAPEGARHRILLLAAPVLSSENGLCDLLLPQEFAILGQAESVAGSHGGDFLWTFKADSTWHWLQYRGGMLAFWSVEHLPAEDQGAWIQNRLAQVKSFAMTDSQFERIETIDVIEGKKSDQPESTIASLCTWGWVRDLNLLEGKARTKLETIRNQHRTLRNALIAVAFILVIGLMLHLRVARVERNLREVEKQAGPLVLLQKEAHGLQDSLSIQVSALQNLGRKLQTNLDLSSALQFIYEALPENGVVENLNVESTGLDGFRYLLQVRVANWDAADLLLANLKKQGAWRAVRLESRRPVGQQGIQVRVEVHR